MRSFSFFTSPLFKLLRLALWLPVWLSMSAMAAQAAPATPPGPAAESFIAANINGGMAILKNPALTPAQRDSQFQTFLLGVTDLKRIALYTLGNAAATPAQTDAFVAAFQNYTVAVYRTYFALYAGQRLTVTGSDVRSPDDVIVHAAMESSGGQPPMKIDFRVRLGGAKTVVTDLGVNGVWLAVSQHDDFQGFLAQHHGDVGALIGHLNEVTAGYTRK